MRAPLTTLTTTPERHEAREQTLAQLAAHGLTPLVSLSIPTRQNRLLEPRERESLGARGHEVITTGKPDKGYGGRNNAVAFRAAFLAAHERKRDLLYCEDDIDLAPDFTWFLQEALEVREAVTWFYTHDYRKDAEQARRYGIDTWQHLRECARYKTPFTPKGLYRMRDASKANSGQCFLVPWEVLDALPLHELDKQTSPVDRWTQDRVPRSGFATLVALPHPVQHRHVRTGREPSRNAAKSSMSFGMR